ncbi:MAG: SDR family oxidoreductase [Candidatus Bathyarchaeota archaeon]|nr:SDR family oxidoreductase [Candidatus Bathyarchaeota archaeon]
MSNKYKSALVTGGAGFIGSHIADRLMKKGFDVTVLDNLDTGHVENLESHKNNGNFHFVKGDIRDLELVRKTLRNIDVVFHEAALASVTLSVQNPILSNDINVTGTLNLLKASSDLGVKRFIYASSAAVYGDTKTPEKREDLSTNPKSPYGISKVAAEHYAKIFYKLYGLETVSLRYFNVYGPRQRFDLDCAYGGVITIFINRLLRNMSPVIFGDGEQTRDFIYISDVVEANMLALDSKDAAAEVFNIGTGLGVSVNQIAEILKNIMNKHEVANIYKDPRPADGRHGYANISKAAKILGFTPRTSITDGLVKLTDWYKSLPQFRRKHGKKCMLEK